MDHTLICMRQLRLISEAKEAWAEANHKPEGTLPTWDDLIPEYLEPPRSCPMRGVYIIEFVGKKPRCTVHRPT